MAVFGFNVNATGQIVTKLFAEGCKGRTVDAFSPLNPEDTYFIYGILRGMTPMIYECQERNIPWYFIDNAYFRRGKLLNYKVSVDALQCGPIIKRPSDRWDKLDVELKPWKKDGSKILVLPPTGYSGEFFKLDPEEWVSEKVEELKKHTDREIKVRRKPKGRHFKTNLTFHEDLQDTFAVVAFTTNGATEAIVEGIPVFTDDINAARHVGLGLDELDKIETPIYPDREDWCNHIGYSQFNVCEFSDGAAWKILCETREIYGK